MASTIDSKSLLTGVTDVTRYLDRFYSKELGAHVRTLDFDFQELSRVMSAKLPYEAGWESIKVIRDLYMKWEPLLSSSLRTIIDQELVAIAKKDQAKDNIRGHIRAIWTAPLKSYLPWIKVESPIAEVILEAAQASFNKVTCRLRANRGCTISALIDPFRQTLWSFEKVAKALSSEAIPGIKLIPNTEESHVTLVHSDVLSSIDQKEWDAFFEPEKKQFVVSDLTPIDVVHTASLDYAPFSLCVTIRFASATIDAFMKRLNIHFKDKMKRPQTPSLHTTVAICLRSS